MSINDLYLGIISGIVSGLFLSLVFQISIILRKPKVKVAKIAIYDEGKGLFCVKVINNSKKRIYGVKCFLQYWEKSGSDVKMTNCNENTQMSPTIPAYCKRDKLKMWAVIYCFEVPENAKFNPDDKLFFQIEALDSGFDSRKYKSQEYRFCVGQNGKEEIVKNCEYEKGKSLNVCKIGGNSL